MSILLIVIVIAVIAAVLYALKRYGIIEKKEFSDGILLESQILYLKYRGTYKDLAEPFHNIVADMGKVFAVSKCFGIYYDSPNQENKNQTRAVIGIIVNRGQQSKIQKFKTLFPKYTHGILPSTRYTSISQPFVNFISYFLASFTIYPKIHEHFKKEEIEDGCPLIQMYHFLSATGKTIEYILPRQNIDAFHLYQ